MVDGNVLSDYENETEFNKIGKSKILAWWLWKENLPQCSCRFKWEHLCALQADINYTNDQYILRVFCCWNLSQYPCWKRHKEFLYSSIYIIESTHFIQSSLKMSFRKFLQLFFFTHMSSWNSQIWNWAYWTFIVVTEGVFKFVINLKSNFLKNLFLSTVKFDIGEANNTRGFMSTKI